MSNVELMTNDYAQTAGDKQPLSYLELCHSFVIRASSFYRGRPLASREVFGFVKLMETQLTWYGQSAFKIATPGGKVLLIDPWLTNPVFEKAKDEIAALKHIDLILVTHGHSDHVGNAVEIGKKK